MDVFYLWTKWIEYSKIVIKDEIVKQYLNFSIDENPNFKERSNEINKNNGFGGNVEKEKVYSTKIK